MEWYMNEVLLYFATEMPLGNNIDVGAGKSRQ